MSDAATHQRPQTGKLRADGRPRQPADGRCKGCGQRRQLVWHHCHDCGRFVEWLCSDCNLTLTEHAIYYWDRIREAHDHHCDPTLPMDLPPRDRQCATHGPRVGTRNLHLANGGGDARYVSVSTIEGYVTVEQLAVIAGINANSARDHASGRQNNRPIGQKIGGAWFIPHAAVVQFLETRWEMTT